MICAWISFTLGCAGTPISLPNTNNEAVNLQNGRQIEAKACGFQLFLLIPIAINGRQERAMNALRMMAGRDLISDVSVQESWTYGFWTYGFVGTSYCTKIHATAYPPLAAQ